jgi:DNA invertase Pin-like site-specific DNA recombinase
MVIGYARVSTNHQDTEMQLTALRLANCDQIFEEHASGRNVNRPVLKRVISMLRTGDELIVWKIDRLGRNVLGVLIMFQHLMENDINFKSITDGIDLKTASGRYNFRNILSAAQYESDLNSERTLAGLAVARSKGHIGGRKRIVTPAIMNNMFSMRENGKTVQEIADAIQISPKTVYKYINRSTHHGSITH